MVGVDMEMPKNCVECNHMDLQQAINCQLIYSGCANCGRHPNCPLVDIEERKVGKWIYDKTSQNWRCSECNKTPKTLGYVGTADFMKKEFVFCNHCGAEMVGAEND